MKSIDMLLSEYGCLSRYPSPVNRMMVSFAEDFRQETDINLGVGYVNERTIPADRIIDAMREVVSRPDIYPVPFNYGGSKGSQNLIDSIRRFYLRYGIGGLTEDILGQRDIIIGPNGATSLLEGIAHIMKPGIVITTDPMYYIYCNFLMRCGYQIIAVPEDDNGIRTDILRGKIDALGKRRDNISFFYIVTVNNPTSTIISNERKADVVRIAGDLSSEQGRKIPVFFDTAYENLVHDPSVTPPESGLVHDEYGIVYEIGTLSKILAPALRIGFMIGPPGPFMNAMVQKTNDAGFSAPLITQETASLLLDTHIADQIERVNDGYKTKARIVGDRIRKELGDYIKRMTGGQAGFYYYLTFSGIETTEDSRFFRFLARTTGDPGIDGPEQAKHPRVIYVPGEFCVHPEGDLALTGKRQLRLSYGFEETERICRAVELMREAAEYSVREDMS